MSEQSERYVARSACADDDDWPHWYVADLNEGGLNVTGRVSEHAAEQRQIAFASRGPIIFASRRAAEYLAGYANDRNLDRINMAVGGVTCQAVTYGGSPGLSDQTIVVATFYRHSDGATYQYVNSVQNARGSEKRNAQEIREEIMAGLMKSANAWRP